VAGGGLVLLSACALLVSAAAGGGTPTVLVQRPASPSSLRLTAPQQAPPAPPGAIDVATAREAPPAGAVTTTTGDVDGDGRLDRVVLDARTGLLTVTFASGAPTATGLVLEVSQGDPHNVNSERLAGVSDLFATGRGLVLVAVSSAGGVGGYRSNEPLFDVYAVDGSSVAGLLRQDGTPFALTANAGRGDAYAGFRCGAGTVTLASATPEYAASGPERYVGYVGNQFRLGPDGRVQEFARKSPGVPLDRTGLWTLDEVVCPGLGPDGYAPFQSGPGEGAGQGPATTAVPTGPPPTSAEPPPAVPLPPPCSADDVVVTAVQTHVLAGLDPYSLAVRPHTGTCTLRVGDVSVDGATLAKRMGQPPPAALTELVAGSDTPVYVVLTFESDSGCPRFSLRPVLLLRLGRTGDVAVAPPLGQSHFTVCAEGLALELSPYLASS